MSIYPGCWVVIGRQCLAAPKLVSVLHRKKSLGNMYKSISQLSNYTMWELKWSSAYHVQKLRGGPQLLSQGLCRVSPPSCIRQLVLARDRVSHTAFSQAVAHLPTSSQFIGLDVQITAGRHSALLALKVLMVEAKGAGTHEPRIPASNIQRIKSPGRSVLNTFATLQIVAFDIFFFK